MLTKGMYDNFTDNRFGLRGSQMRSQDNVVHNGGWYNIQGEKLGWGDLSHEDALRISNELQKGEVFIVLSESDSFWAYVDFSDNTVDRASEHNPGRQEVLDKARYVFVPGRRMRIVRDEYVDHENTYYINDVKFEVVKRSELNEILNAVCHIENCHD